jgi:hypothetical protein
MDKSQNFRGVRVHVSTGYNRVKRNRRASRKGLVSALPPEIPNVTIRNFCIAVMNGRGRLSEWLRRVLAAAVHAPCDEQGFLHHGERAAPG